SIGERANGSKPNAAQFTPDQGPWGVNINNLPLASANPDDGVAPGRGGPRTAAPRKPGSKPEKDDTPANPYHPDKTAKADAPADKDPAPAAPTAPPEPELQPPPTEAPPPPDQRAPLNRASALTALSRAANSVAACKRDGGPTGVGSAS